MTVYVLDTEFLELANQPLQPTAAQPPVHADAITLQLLSIGIVTHDRELYVEVAEAVAAAPTYANPFVRTHVLPNLTGPAVPRTRAAELVADFFTTDPAPEIWAYYGPWDVVAVAGLFGGMHACPPWWPWRFHDLADLEAAGAPPLHDDLPHHALADARAEHAYFLQHRHLLARGHAGRGT